MKDISNINNKNNIFECQLISFFLKVSTLLKMQIMFIMAGRLKKSQKYQHLILHFQELTFRLFELCLYYGHIWRISKSTKISTFWFILRRVDKMQICVQFFDFFQKLFSVTISSESHEIQGRFSSTSSVVWQKFSLRSQVQDV